MTAGLRLEGRRALVMPGTSETGAACVRRLREERMAVAFTGEGREGDRLAAETGTSFIQCDPGDRASLDRALEQALELGGGRLDVLVTAAGMLLAGSLQATSEAVFREIVEVNLTGAFRAARACFATMRAQGGGSMIHISSDAGIRAVHETAAYSVTSAGVIAVAELFAAEGAPHGIRSNAVCPAAGVDASAVVAWLASEASSPVSGATLRVDGAAGAAMTQDTRS